MEQNTGLCHIHNAGFFYPYNIKRRDEIKTKERRKKNQRWIKKTKSGTVQI